MEVDDDVLDIEMSEAYVEFLWSRGAKDFEKKRAEVMKVLEVPETIEEETERRSEAELEEEEQEKDVVREEESFRKLPKWSLGQTDEEIYSKRQEYSQRKWRVRRLQQSVDEKLGRKSDKEVYLAPEIPNYELHRHEYVERRARKRARLEKEFQEKQAQKEANTNDEFLNAKFDFEQEQKRQEEAYETRIEEVDQRLEELRKKQHFSQEVIAKPDRPDKSSATFVRNLLEEKKIREQRMLHREEKRKNRQAEHEAQEKLELQEKLRLQKQVRLSNCQLRIQQMQKKRELNKQVNNYQNKIVKELINHPRQYYYFRPSEEAQKRVQDTLKGKRHPGIHSKVSYEDSFV